MAAAKVANSADQVQAGTRAQSTTPRTRCETVESRCAGRQRRNSPYVHAHARCRDLGFLDEEELLNEEESFVKRVEEAIIDALNIALDRRAPRETNKGVWVVLLHCRIGD